MEKRERIFFFYSFAHRANRRLLVALNDQCFRSILSLGM